ncbi:response regulator [Subtercola boreus]|uniref:Response regulatory domain-containing protein n=1 Tax=Subtercola boreus TaxID=120213 RepID=A0A3E0WED4_9MICO|nr:response regulator [Subtercola boreus]RFA23598.1 hypothetical protein B7R24_01605 [Subtercola boreus]RFA23992.1 hypothetical protein B7R23_01605 [Subtercola boreus]RFA29690.1 hypothetical protein B7R25_01600 [Subtercola boreus]
MSPELARGAAPVRTLVVDDEEITASAHAAYLGRVGGFEVAGIAHTGREAVRQLRVALGDSAGSVPARDDPVPDSASRALATPAPDDRPAGIDLVLLDMNLPDLHGLDLCRQIRSAGLETDVIAITAVREVGVVRASLSLGIVQYLIKPFTYATFADRLRTYLDFRRGFGDDRLLATQGEVDDTFVRMRSVAPAAYEKGLSEGTLQLVVQALAGAPHALSATELSDAAAVSRVTARRYLEHLVATGVAAKSSRYGAPGRPEVEYRLTGR